MKGRFRLEPRVEEEFVRAEAEGSGNKRVIALGLVSAAISLKRIADALEEMNKPVISGVDAATLRRLTEAGVVTDPPAPDDKWIHSEEIAERWGISRITLWKWRKAGLLPDWEKMGARVGLRQSVVDATFERLKVGRPWLGTGKSK